MQQATKLIPDLEQDCAALPSSIPRTVESIDEQHSVVESLSQKAVLQPPILLAVPTVLRLVLMGGGAAFANGFALLLLVFVCQSLRSLAKDPERVAKLQGIGQALRGRPVVQ